jgi:hypothetical protein
LGSQLPFAALCTTEKSAGYSGRPLSSRCPFDFALAAKGCLPPPLTSLLDKSDFRIDQISGVGSIFDCSGFVVED